MAWPLFFLAMSGIHRYDRSTSVAEWLAAAVRSVGSFAPGLAPLPARLPKGSPREVVLREVPGSPAPRGVAAARSEMKPSAKWVYRILAPLILGGCVLAALASFLVPLEDTTLPEWASGAPARAAVSACCLLFALWLSARLSRLLDWVELDAIHLRWKGLWARRVREESLCSVRKIDPDGTIGFSDGRKIHFDGHRPAGGAAIAGQIAWWHANGMKHPEAT
jgi:hypothetical protein